MPLLADSIQGIGRSEPRQQSKVPSKSTTNSAVVTEKSASQSAVLERPPKLPQQQKKHKKQLQKPQQSPTLLQEQQQQPMSSSPRLQEDVFPKQALQPDTQKRKQSQSWSNSWTKSKTDLFNSSNSKPVGIQLPDPVQSASGLLIQDPVHPPAPQARASADSTPSHARRDALPRTDSDEFPESEKVMNGFHARQAFGLDTYLRSSGSPVLPHFVSC